MEKRIILVYIFLAEETLYPLAARRRLWVKIFRIYKLHLNPLEKNKVKTNLQILNQVTINPIRWV